MRPSRTRKTVLLGSFFALFWRFYIQSAIAYVICSFSPVSMTVYLHRHFYLIKRKLPTAFFAVGSICFYGFTVDVYPVMEQDIFCISFGKNPSGELYPKKNVNF